MPLPLLLAVSPPMLLAASPLPSTPYEPSRRRPVLQSIEPMPEGGPVETFDPAARAQRITALMPRLWRGTYRSFGGGPSLPAELRINGADARGQMVVLEGELRVGELASRVQGNLNAKSDQLDLLVLDQLPGVELGTEFQGLQGLSLMGLYPSRLTNPGGRLQLNPMRGSAPGAGSASGAGSVRGLW